MIPTLILASASPRRQAFLRALKLDFLVAVANIDEAPLDGERPSTLAARLAMQKAQTVAAHGRIPHSLIIAADTVVALDDQLLGKPSDAAEAFAMLAALRGRDHHVVSAVSVLETEFGRQQVRVNDTLVSMRDYSDPEITSYIASGDPFDKAGGYAIQHPDFRPVRTLKGCISSVMGLPLADLRDLLAEFGVTVSSSLPLVCENHGEYTCCQRPVTRPSNQ